MSIVPRHGNVKGQARRHGKGAGKMCRKVTRELAHAFLGELPVAFEIGPSAYIEDDTGNCFVHRDTSIRKPPNVLFFAKCVGEGFTHDQTDVFDGMVLVDPQVAITGDREIKQSVGGE
jgi:hypothetical protein